MLTETNATPTIAVKDLNTARNFYGKTLGLKPIGETNEMVQLFKSGNSTIEVYQSDFAGTNQATAMTWEVGDNLEEEVRNLRSKGVELDRKSVV